MYTDPQVHSHDQRGFGKGNMGMDGIRKFFDTHKCNALCRYLGLVQSGKVTKDQSGTMMPSSGSSGNLADHPSERELQEYGLTRAEFNHLRDQFYAADTDKSGEISINELGILCGMLGYKCSARNLVHLLNSVDRDGNGQISLHEFLLWWTGQ
uniref:Alpha-type protein kinase domain-containing protein n=2 Tax=Eutreptiella gymnastica TaxID=73025 RepID=A0A7S1JAC5_9EUGL|mmetsp:Transcript_7728/g.13706  ORF Transcript_7728/g.13706 Transcript_7728/m.13706 type:complete len:153 (+) Transcript_7728:324-782(+)